LQILFEQDRIVADTDAEAVTRVAQRAYELAAQRQSNPEQDKNLVDGTETPDGGPRIGLFSREFARFMVSGFADEQARRRSLVEDASVLELYRLSGKRQSTLVQAMQVIKRDHAHDAVGREAQKLLLDALYLVRRRIP